VLLFPRCFYNLHQPMGREKPGDSHPIINEWGGAQVVPGQVRAVPEPERGQSEMQY
jgi:hypothetical protein